MSHTYFIRYKTNIIYLKKFYVKVVVYHAEQKKIWCSIDPGGWDKSPQIAILSEKVVSFFTSLCIWEYIWSCTQKPWKKFHPQLFSRENIFEEFWVYRPLDIYLKWKFFKKFFVSINVEGWKFLPEIEANFQFLLFSVVTTKKIYRKFFNQI